MDSNPGSVPPSFPLPPNSSSLGSAAIRAAHSQTAPGQNGNQQHTAAHFQHSQYAVPQASSPYLLSPPAPSPYLALPIPNTYVVPPEVIRLIPRMGATDTYSRCLRCCREESLEHRQNWLHCANACWACGRDASHVYGHPGELCLGFVDHRGHKFFETRDPRPQIIRYVKGFYRLHPARSSSSRQVPPPPVDSSLPAPQPRSRSGRGQIARTRQPAASSHVTASGVMPRHSQQRVLQFGALHQNTAASTAAMAPPPPPRNPSRAPTLSVAPSESASVVGSRGGQRQHRNHGRRLGQGPRSDGTQLTQAAVNRVDQASIGSPMADFSVGVPAPGSTFDISPLDFGQNTQQQIQDTHMGGLDQTPEQQMQELRARLQALEAENAFYRHQHMPNLQPPTNPPHAVSPSSQFPPPPQAPSSSGSTPTRFRR